MRVTLLHILTTYYCISFTVSHMVCHSFAELKHCSMWFFIFNSLISKDIEEIFLYLSAICMFSLDKCLNHLPIFKLCYLTFNCWVVFLYIFWIHSLYQIHDLPLRSTFCRLSFCFPIVFFPLFFFFFFFFFWCLVILHRLWDLSSLKRDWTWPHSRDSTKS